MSIHLDAEKGAIASTVLLPGDPLRAQHVADRLLENAVCVNRTRGMLGFTGFWQGKRVSVMGTGMGIPSLSIYVHELVAEHAVKTLIRIGTCGALGPGLEMGDIVLAEAASTDSGINRIRFGGMSFAPVADFDLLLAAYTEAKRRDVRVHVGGVLSSDTFYQDDPDWWRVWADHGVLAVEMETSGLYTLAATFDVAALSILTVTDNLVAQAAVSAEQRERGSLKMAEIALAIAQ